MTFGCSAGKPSRRSRSTSWPGPSWSRCPRGHFDRAVGRARRRWPPSPPPLLAGDAAATPRPSSSAAPAPVRRFPVVVDVSLIPGHGSLRHRGLAMSFPPVVSIRCQSLSITISNASPRSAALCIHPVESRARHDPRRRPHGRRLGRHRLQGPQRALRRGRGHHGARPGGHQRARLRGEPGRPEPAQPPHERDRHPGRRLRAVQRRAAQGRGGRSAAADSSWSSTPRAAPAATAWAGSGATSRGSAAR